MTDRLIGPTGSKRRKRFLIVPILVIAAAALLLVGAAQAVHDNDFQLDGDVVASTQTNNGTPAHIQHFDWDSFFNAAGNPIQASFPDASVPGFTASGFDRDFSLQANGNYDSSDTTTYTNGSKDTLNISTGWACTKANNTADKGDIQNAYAVAYTDPGSTDQILYFGMERNSNNGDANVAFWFLQDEANCTSPTGPGSANWTGNHQDGDILVVSAFTNGGVVSNIDAYRWNGGAGGSLGTTPVASGGDCTATNPAAPSNDPACATANKASITTPWLTNNNGKSNGTGHTSLTAEFFEGGINLSDTGLAGKCFNVFVADTRSSQSLGASLFDFARGKIGECTSKTETTPVDNAGNPIPAGGLNIPADPADASIAVRDKATVTVSGATSFTGTLSFHLCGPFAAGTTTVCGSGGVAVDSQSITTNGTYTSAAATVTAAGRYCWRADFSASSPTGIPSSSDSRASECFKVNPIKPTLTTEAGAGPVDFGQPVTDTATLTGTAHRPGSGGPAGSTDGSINPTTLGGDAQGLITFTLYKDATCTTKATGTGTNPQTRSISGDGSYGPVSFTPDAPGTYHWVATYPGDLPNTTKPDDVACDDANEDVVVRQIPTDIKTKQSWYPNDTATVSATTGNLAGGGSVLFELFTTVDCPGAAVFSETKSISGGAPTEEVGTNNTTYKITTGYTDPADSLVGRHSWKVTYTPATGDTAHTGSRSTCDSEHFNITYTNDAGPGADLP
jgi:hypothetical protein